MAQRFRTDLKDEIVQGGYKLWRAVSASGTILLDKFKMERTNSNAQDGDNFGAKEVNAIHAFLNGLLDGTEKTPWSGIKDITTTTGTCVVTFPYVGNVNIAYRKMGNIVQYHIDLTHSLFPSGSYTLSESLPFDCHYVVSEGSMLVGTVRVGEFTLVINGRRMVLISDGYGGAVTLQGTITALVK